MTMLANPLDLALQNASSLVVVQRRELGELIGFETRNKYEIMTESRQPVGFAAEQSKGALAFLARQMVGHWRTYDLVIFDAQRQQRLVAHHPFRWFFQRLEVAEAGGIGRRIGAIQQRWAWFSKRFDVEDAQGDVVLTVSSPFWRIWTFAFMRGDREVARIEKKWSGVLREAFTDADTFRVSYQPGPVSIVERLLLLGAALFIDLQYFEKKAGR